MTPVWNHTCRGFPQTPSVSAPNVVSRYCSLNWSRISSIFSWPFLPLENSDLVLSVHVRGTMGHGLGISIVAHTCARMLHAQDPATTTNSPNSGPSFHKTLLVAYWSYIVTQKISPVAISDIIFHIQNYGPSIEKLRPGPASTRPYCRKNRLLFQQRVIMHMKIDKIA